MNAIAKPASVERELTGIALVMVIVVLSLGNFLAILDMTIANVLVSHIAGSLATSPSNGTWVITAYGVAEAIMVPLTGWLAGRFGPVKVFIVGIVGFAFFSLLCGMATSLNMLIVFRVFLGICGGPLIPVSQALLVRLVPTRYSAVALTVWSMGSVLAPVTGPVIGGLIGDNMYWGWAFYFKVPLALGIAVIAWTVLRSHETEAVKSKVDFVGLALLVVWVGALQIMLGNGQDMDWFHSDLIVALLVITVLGLVCFVAWEITALQPIVNLQILRNRVFWVSVVVIGISFSCMSGSIVLLPMWLQSGMGYTATWAGYNMAVMGITMLATAPVAGYLISRFDTRVIVFIGLLIAAASDLMRIGYTDQVTFWQLMWPQLVFGIGMVLTMVPLIEMSTSALSDRDIPSGSGQFNFVRTLGSALATAIVVAFWNNETRSAKAALVGSLQNSRATMDNAQQLGMSVEQSRGVLDQVVSGQSVMQATNTTFMLLGIFTVAAACFIWLSPKPPKRTGGANPAMH